MAKKQKAAEPAVASLNPQDMLQGGLKDDFRGVIREAVYTTWDYDGNIDEKILAARLTIDVEGDEDPFVQHWSAGDLANFVPSQDGEEAAEEDDEGNMVGPFALRVGKRTGLNNNTNFAHLMQSIIDAGTLSKKFTAKHLAAANGSLAVLEGLDANFSRVPQKKRSGLVDDGEEKKSRDVLVVDEVFGYRDKDAKGTKAKVKAKAKAAEAEEEEDEEEEEEEEAKPVTKKKGKAPVEEDEEEDEEEEAEEGDDDEEESEDDDEEVSPLDAKLRKVVLKAIKAAPNSKIKKGKLATIVLNAMGTDKDKPKAVKRVTADDFLSAGPWEYDEDAGTLSVE